MKKSLLAILLSLSLAATSALLISCSKDEAKKTSAPETSSATTTTKAPEVDSDMPDEVKAEILGLLDGVYVSEDNDSITVTNKDDAISIEISIIRLASMEGMVTKVDDSNYTFVAEDPNGEDISGTIALKDKTATLTFTDSKWEYIENGTEFTFTKSSLPTGSAPQVETENFDYEGTYSNDDGCKVIVTKTDDGYIISGDINRAPAFSNANGSALGKDLTFSGTDEHGVSLTAKLSWLGKNDVIISASGDQWRSLTGDLKMSLTRE